MPADLEGLLARHHEADLVEMQLLAGKLRQDQVRVMDGIEGAAEEADPHGYFPTDFSAGVPAGAVAGQFVSTLGAVGKRLRRIVQYSRTSSA